MSCPNAANVNIKSFPPGECLPVEGCPGGPPVECSIADGADVTEGATTDARSGDGDNSGTVNAHLRQLAFKQSEAITAQQVYTNIQPIALACANQGLGSYVQSRDMEDGNLGNYDQILFTPQGPCVLPWKVGGVFGGSNFSFWSVEREPSRFFSVQAVNAGNTPLWTPTLTQKFRLMRYQVVVTGDAATAGGAVVTISLNDAGAAMAQDHDVFIPGAGLNTFPLYNSGWIDIGNGVLSAAANNVLNVNLSAALTAGNVRVICCGTEE